MQKTPLSCSTASNYQSTPAQTIMTDRFLSIPLPQRPCPSYSNVHVRQPPSLHHPSPTRTNICVTNCYKCIEVPKNCVQWDDEVYVLPRNLDAKPPRVMGQNACHIQLLIARTQKKSDYQRCASFATRFSICNMPYF